MSDTGTPDKYRELNVQTLSCQNVLDGDNPTGGGVQGIGLNIEWQNGPRTPDAKGNLAPSNGAFVEDAIYAAIQRLQFFQGSKYKHDGNANAIFHLEQALSCLNARRQDRSKRGVEGKHEV